MKTLSALAESLRRQTACDVVWVVEIDWPSGTCACASSPLSLGDYTAAPLLKDFVRENGQRHDAQTGSTLPLDLLTAIINNPTNANAPFLKLLEEYSALGLEMRLRVLFLDPPACSASAEDMLTVFSGRVRRCDAGQTEIRLEAEDAVSSAGSKVIGRTLNLEMVDGLPEESAGRMSPWVFGEAKGVPLLALQAAVETRLRTWLHARAPVIPVVSLEGFPSAGTIQVGEELIVYNSVDAQARTFGTLLQPVSRGFYSPQRAGAGVRLVPAGGFEFLVADHPCQSVAEVLADGQAVDPQDYSAALETIGGHSAQKLVFSQWPTRTLTSGLPGQMILEGYKSTRHWFVQDSNTAVNALLAVDEEPVASHAAVGDGYSLLSLGILPSLGDTAERYGEIAAARLVVRYRADQTWGETTLFQLSVAKWGELATMDLPSPASAEEEAIVALEIDAAPEYADWMFFKQDPLNVAIEKVGAASSHELRVLDIAWEIDHAPYSEVRQAEVLTATVSGLEQDESLIENPADVIHALLTHERLGGLPAAAIDAELFARTRAGMEARGYRFSRLIQSHETLGSLLRSALDECRCRLVASGERLRLLLAEDEAPQEMAMTLDENLVLEARSLGHSTAHTADPPSAVRVLYDADWAAPARERYAAGQSCSIASIGPFGEEQIATIRALWLAGDASAAADLALHRLRTLRAIRPLARATLPLRAVHLDAADAIAVDLPGARAAASVAAIEQREAHRLDMRIALAPISARAWESEDFRVEIATDLSALSFWHGTRQLGRLCRDGALELRGQVIERAFSALEAAEAVAIDASRDWLVFAVEGVAGFEAVAALDSEGNLRLRGALREKAVLDPVAMTAWWTLDEAVFALGTGLEWPAAAYDAAADCLFLPGQAREKAWE